MKNLSIFLLLMIITSSSLIAQETDTTVAKSEYKTIFSKTHEKTKVSGFGSMAMDFMNVDNNFGLMMGGEGAVLINNSFYIGFYGRGLATMPEYNYSYYVDTLGRNADANKRLMFGHGGLFIGYIIHPEKPIHLGFNTKFGIGSVGIVEDYSNGNMNHNSFDYNNNAYFYPIYVFTPQIDLEMNITYWFKFKISAGYQFVSSQTISYTMIENGGLVEKKLLNTQDLNAPSISMGFVFGWFK